MQDAAFHRQLLGYDKSSVDARMNVLERTVEALALQLAQAQAELVALRGKAPTGTASLKATPVEVEAALEKVESFVGLDPRD